MIDRSVGRCFIPGLGGPVALIGNAGCLIKGSEPIHGVLPDSNLLFCLATQDSPPWASRLSSRKAGLVNLPQSRSDGMCEVQGGVQPRAASGTLGTLSGEP